MSDLISRQALCEYALNQKDKSVTPNDIMRFPSAQPETKWIPVTERLPEDLAEVNVTWINTDPEPYYDFVKDKPATGSAVYYKGDWYWYSSVTQDVLAEYGRMDSEKFDDAVRVIAWMPLPEPYAEDGMNDDEIIRQELEQKCWIAPKSDDAAKRLSDLIFDINPAEICAQIEADNLKKWCKIIQVEMKMALVQLPY